MIALFLCFVIMTSFLMKQCVASDGGVAPSKQRRSNVNTAFVPSSSSPILSAPRRSTMKTISRQSSLGNKKFLQPRAMMMLHPSSSLLDSSSLIASNNISLQSAQLTDAIDSTTATAASVQIEQQDPTTTIIIFIIGIIPFIWATFEFWRRIAVGASFGTTSDSVVIPSPFDNDDSDKNDMITIGEDGNPMSSRGRRTLDRGALSVAYVLFAIAAGSVGLAVASVVMGPTTPL